MENDYAIRDGKRIILLEDNIAIVPSKMSHLDKDVAYVFPHPQPREKVLEVYRTLKQ